MKVTAPRARMASTQFGSPRSAAAACPTPCGSAGGPESGSCSSSRASLATPQSCSEGSWSTRPPRCLAPPPPPPPPRAPGPPQCARRLKSPRNPRSEGGHVRSGLVPRHGVPCQPLRPPIIPTPQPLDSLRPSGPTARVCELPSKRTAPATPPPPVLLPTC